MTKLQFYRESIANSKAALARPNVRYPNGRMSHDVEREYLARMEDEMFEYTLENGLYDANGRLVAYAEDDAA